MTLPPFNPDARCPKCGGAEVRVEYFSAGQLTGDPHLDLYEEEIIARTCTRCGYAWPEAPLDHVDDANEMVREAPLDQETG